MSSTDESYREKCFRVHGDSCTVCGSDEKVVAHHRDGDRDNDDESNLMPVCGSCHWKIHGGDIEEFSDELPASSRHDLPNDPDTEVRPHIRVSYTLDGYVKDYADRNDMTFAEAYREIIETGLEELEAQEE